MRKVRSLGCVALLVSLGCGVQPTPPARQVTSTRQSALTVSNGTNLNGTNLNGTNLNGTNLNGSTLGSDSALSVASVDYAGATRERLNGNKLDAVWIEGSEFYGQQGTSVFHGMDFDDVSFNATLTDGSPVTLEVKDELPPPEGSDLWRYEVAYWDPNYNDWMQLCPQPDGTNAPAIPVKGVWNYQWGTVGGGSWSDDSAHFTFACEHAAVAKCIEMGYAPWHSVNGVSLNEHMQACVRVIRADYCGDGTSYTVNGQLVDIYDALGIQADDEDWYFEAEWDKTGARCFSPHNRYHANVPCYQNRTQSDCGALSHFSSGTLLMTETPYKD